MDVERTSMDVDIVVVGFGPASAGFLSTLTRGLAKPDGTPLVESKAMPGMAPQVLCYERADDLGFGVSGVVTKGRAIKAALPGMDMANIPLAAPIAEEKLVWLFDAVGASKRSMGFKLMDRAVGFLGERDRAVELPYIPPFLDKHGGFVCSLGQFLTWVGGEIAMTGLAQIWPASPVAAPLFDNHKVVGVRMADQGVDKQGNPDAAFMPGMDVKAGLTVMADGPVGPVSRAVDAKYGLPVGKHRREWALGMKMVVDLDPALGLKPGTVIHTLGFPEPELFGFLYVLPDNIASLGIFVPSWFDAPVRTAYRYMQHWMAHPYMAKFLKGAKMRSWGAKSILESGLTGEPYLVGDGFAKIGEGSGTTNILTGSGVDEAWFSGTILAGAVLDLMLHDMPFTRENLEHSYVAHRRSTWLEHEAEIAEKARDGFTKGVPQGLLGMAMSGFTHGKFNWPGLSKPVYARIKSLKEHFKDVPRAEVDRIERECTAKGETVHDAFMDRAGWPKVELDGELFVSHQDALLIGGKVQAAPGFADHVRFLDPARCAACEARVCAEMCSGQAITVNPVGGVPLFDREKCVHCGACLWNCSKAHPADLESTNVDFQAGAGGFHSAEN